MRPLLFKLSDFFHDLARKRFALPVLAVLAAGVLYSSEQAYRGTVSALRSGIALTEQRIDSASLLQSLTDLEAAEFGYLLTRQKEYVVRHERTSAELPVLIAKMVVFFTSLGDEGTATARRVEELAYKELTQSSETMALVQTGNIVAATEMAGREQSRSDMQALHALLRTKLDEATTRQHAFRVSIYSTLEAGRLAVGMLTFLTLVGLFLFVRQLKRQDRERSTELERLEVEVQRRTLQITELARHFESVREDERSRIARELHDELGAMLTVSKLDIARARKKADQPDEIVASLDRVTQSLNKGIELKRRIIEDLTPSALTHLGLSIALQNFCHDMSLSLGIPVLLSTVELRLKADARLMVYRFIQEALTNVGKYAAATQVKVTLNADGNNATVTVHDDGAGFDTQASRAGHHGLNGMQFRAESLGGSLTIQAAPGEGATLCMRFPQLAEIGPPEEDFQQFSQKEPFSASNTTLAQ